MLGIDPWSQGRTQEAGHKMAACMDKLGFRLRVYRVTHMNEALFTTTQNFVIVSVCS